MKYAIGIAAAALIVSGCATDGSNGAGLRGGLLGGLAGAAACLASNANDTECALLVLGGAVAGYAIADYIDRRDQAAYQQATQAVLNGETLSATRVSEETGNSITVSRAADAAMFENSAGESCTATDVSYQGDTHEDVWCRDANGTWTIRQA